MTDPEKLSPYECGFEKYVNLDNNIEFLGKEKLKDIKSKGIERKLMGVILDLEKLSITKSLDIYENEKKIGDLRSACFSPHFKKVIGIAMISKPFCKVSQTVYLNIDGKKVSGKVCDLPFI